MSWRSHTLLEYRNTPTVVRNWILVQRSSAAVNEETDKCPSFFNIPDQLFSLERTTNFSLTLTNKSMLTGPMIWKSLEVEIVCYRAAWNSVEEAVKEKVDSCVIAQICEVITENGAGYCENCHHLRKQMRNTVWSPKPTLFLITKSPCKLCDYCNDWTARKCMGTWKRFTY